MFCGKCGNEIMDGSAFCPECGERLNGITYNNENYSEPNKPTKNLKKRIICIVFAVAVVFGAVGIFRAIFSDSAEDVAIKYAEAVTKGDLNKAMQYLPLNSDEYFDFLESFLKSKAKEYDRSIDEFYEELEEKYENEYDIKVDINNLSDLFECSKEICEYAFKEEFGDDYKISVDIIDTEKISRAKIKQSIKEMKETIEDIEDEYYTDHSLNDYFDTDKVEEGYKFECEFSIEGEENSYSDTEDIYVAKFNGKWKVIDSPKKLKGIRF